MELNMNRKRTWKGLAAAVAGLGLMAGTVSAQAGFVMTADDPGTAGIDMVMGDNLAAGVFIASLGVVTTHADNIGAFSQMNSIASFGTWSFTVNTGTTVPLTTAGTVMDLNINATSSAGGSLVVSMTNTGFSSPAAGALLNLGLAGIAQGGASVSYSAYTDAGNAEFATTSLIASLGPASGVLAATGSGPGAAATPYSITQVVTLSHAAAGNSNFQAIVSADEPAILALIGLGLMLTALGKRRAS